MTEDQHVEIAEPFDDQIRNAPRGHLAYLKIYPHIVPNSQADTCESHVPDVERPFWLQQ